jgi:hypothetical protein
MTLKVIPVQEARKARTVGRSITNRGMKCKKEFEPSHPGGAAAGAFGLKTWSSPGGSLSPLPN